MRKAVAAIAWLVVSSSLEAATLFPTPLHLVRRIEDPISRTTTTLDEFCYGGRIVSVTANGSRVAITDYDAQLLTEIDHAAATYSVTRFDDIAKARPHVDTPSKATVTVSVDRSVALSRDAVEAIVGAAYPNRRDSRHEQILAAAAPSSGGRLAAQSAESAYGLPTDTSIEFEEGLVYRNVVIRFDHDLPPPQAMLIDPGATRVESRLTRMTRELRQLDKLPRQ
jgi:hypothetical protein